MTLASALELGSDFYGPLFIALGDNTSRAGSWTLEKDPQRADYRSVREENESCEYDWLDDAHKNMAYGADSMVALHWYKDTQVGSYNIAALDMYWLAKTLVAKFPEIFA